MSRAGAAAAQACAVLFVGSMWAGVICFVLLTAWLALEATLTTIAAIFGG